MAKTTLPTLEEMMAAGVHFGHRTRQWNPKMGKYIFGTLEGIHIIDLEKTYEQLENAIKFLEEKDPEKATIVFVGTKRQAAPVIAQIAGETGAYYITDRWPGGLITNFDNIRKAIEHYEELITQKEDTEKFEKLNNKDRFALLKEIDRLGKIFGGLRGLNRKPNILIIIDPRREKTALLEAQKGKATTISMVDTNSDPTGIDCPIPANDDALRSIETVLRPLADAASTKVTKKTT